MLTQIRRAYQWLLDLFRPKLVDLAPAPEEAAPAEAKKPRSRFKDTAHIADVEESGRWYFKRDILDRLDQYFHYLKRLRRHDPEAYDLYCQVGGYINNTHGGVKVCMNPGSRLDSSWKVEGHLPGFACVTFPECDDDVERDTIRPKLMYFQKVDRSYYCEPSVDTVYKVTAFMAERADPRLNHPITFHVAVDKDNRPRVLREMRLLKQMLPPSRVAGTKYGWKQVTHVSWGLNSGLAQLAGEVKRREPNHEHWTTQHQGIFIFSLIANTHATASADIHIRVTRGNLVGLFCVDLLRTPYFFNDRETGLARDGKRKRIFHIVRTFKRNHKDGSHRYVKSHFRGERTFLWNQHKVQISMPGKHHAILNMFSGGFTDEELMNERKGTMTPKQLGEGLARHMTEGWAN